MAHLFRYVFLICVVTGLMQPPEARADSLPTFTATSASASVGFIISWSISGNDFSLGGVGVKPGPLVFDAPPGSSLADYAPNFSPFGLASYFGADSGFTQGSVTINGVSESVQLQTTPEINFSIAGVTVPYGANPVISLDATLTGSAAAAECLGPGLIPVACGSSSPYGYFDVANINIDVPGVITFYGSNPDPTDPAQGFVTFTTAKFTSLPEPVSGSLACIGLMLLAGAAKFRREKT